MSRATGGNRRGEAVSSRACLVGVVTLGLAFGAVGCRRAPPPAPNVAAPPESAPEPAAESAPESAPESAAESAATLATEDDLQELAPEAGAHYREALRLVAAGALDEAQASLEQAVEVEADFTEGWYNLGATYGNQAVRDAGFGEDASALEFFRKAVAAKARSRDLMNAGKWFLYRESERAVVLHDVEEALVDADEVLADETSLLAGLRLRAMGVRHPAE